MNKIVSIFFFLTAPLGASAQAGEHLSHADCSDPIELVPGQEYVHEASPEGYGARQSFEGNNGIPHLFPAEINTVWYSFKAPMDGLIVFEVQPFRALDDYDWMLFEQKSESSCDSIAGYLTKPVRSNRARNDLDIAGKTGLHPDFGNLHAPPGPGKSYSKPVSVKRGDSYLLVLDNIYAGGQGHRIILNYAGWEGSSVITVKVRIVDKLTGEPLSARVFAEEDSTGHSLLNPAAVSGLAADTAGAGLADFTFRVPGQTPVHLAALKKGYLLAAENFTAGTTDTSVVLRLEPADKGSRMILFNIRFLPNKAEFQPNAVPELQRLLEFMRQSSEKYIRIIGHTNSNVFANKGWLLDLSVYRAAAVRDYLISHGVEQNRIRIAGAGGSQPLVESNDMKEAMKNLRVEIELLN